MLEQDTAEHAAPLLAGAHVIVLADGDDEKRAAFYADINLADCLAAADENVVLIALDAAALTAAGLAVPERIFA